MGQQKQVNFVITDLDDTIWDWLSMWYNSFNPYLNRISQDLNVDIDLLKNDFKNLHKKYGTTESSFIFEELESLKNKDLKKITKNSKLKRSILHEYYSNKKNNLNLYNGVYETLKEIKAKGAIIIGFTESNAFFTKYRIKHLNLDGLIDCIYAPIDTGVPATVNRYYSEEFWEPKITEIRYLSKKIRKPDSEILEIILKDFGGDKINCIYIGDKLDRDILMAQEASIDSVHASYGHLIEGNRYELLKQVTHWTDEDVKREAEFKSNYDVNPKPTYTLAKSFKELLTHFSFFPFEARNSLLKVDNVIKIWEKVVDVQQHFNDIGLRIRNLTLTLFTFLIGAIGFLEKENIRFNFNCHEIKASAALCFLGMLIIFPFLFMDRFWYHKLLVGSVKQGMYIENKWAKHLPEMGLANAIKDESPNKMNLFGYKKCKIEIHSSDKFWFFYLPLFLTLGGLGIALLVI